jgi:hypothetical protein
MKSTAIDIQSDKLHTICERFGVGKLSIFGSLIHGTATDESDLDILVEFLPDRTPGFAYVDLEDELSALFHRKVDLHTASSLSQYFRENVVREAQIVYAHR